MGFLGSLLAELHPYREAVGHTLEVGMEGVSVGIFVRLDRVAERAVLRVGSTHGSCLESAGGDGAVGYDKAQYLARLHQHALRAEAAWAHVIADEGVGHRTHELGKGTRTTHERVPVVGLVAGGIAHGGGMEVFEARIFQLVAACAEGADDVLSQCGGQVDADDGIEFRPRHLALHTYRNGAQHRSQIVAFAQSGDGARGDVHLLQYLQGGCLSVDVRGHIRQPDIPYRHLCPQHEVVELQGVEPVLLLMDDDGGGLLCHVHPVDTHRQHVGVVCGHGYR